MAGEEEKNIQSYRLWAKRNKTAMGVSLAGFAGSSFLGTLITIMRSKEVGTKELETTVVGASLSLASFFLILALLADHFVGKYEKEADRLESQLSHV